MASIHIERVIYHLAPEMKRALTETLSELGIQTNHDINDVFRTFRRQVDRKCSTWEDIPDDHVETTCRNCGKQT